MMGRTVGELLDTCSYPELVEWGEYYAEEPFGEWRADVRSGLLASVIANCNRDQKQRPEPYMIDDFMVFDKRRKAIEMLQDDADDGAHIAPETIAWLFAKAGHSVH